MLWSLALPLHSLANGYQLTACIVCGGRLASIVVKQGQRIADALLRNGAAASTAIVDGARLHM
jgi:hypothetical protein